MSAKSPLAIVGYWLLAGVVFQVLVYHSLNAFHFSTWLHVVFWLPLLILAIIVKLFWWLLTVLILAALLIWGLSLVFPKVGMFVAYVFQNAMKTLRLA